MASRFAVGFDFDHTLGIDNKLERTIILETLATYARDHAATYDVAVADAAVDDVLQSYRVGTLTPEVAVAGFLERFAPVHGAAVMDAANAFRERVMSRASTFIQAVDGAEALLAKLVEMDVPVALLTNGWSPFQEEKARIIGFPGPVFVSERIGIRKPAPEAFAHLAHAFDRAPVDIFYVGDDPLADCVGAREAGMHSVWFDWEGKTYPSDLAGPEFTINKLEDFIILLQGRG
jgi:HAD superfamily hydrolase (TIGR01549 family)